MKKILSFWLFFAIVFFATVAICYTIGVDANIVIVVLLLIYLAFQIFSLRQAYKYGRDWILASIILQAILAMCAPLYFSNFWDPVYEYITGTWLDNGDSLYPCQLCWWARIMMFPIVPLSLIALYTKSRPILWYIYAISIPGMALEIFHYLLQKINIPNPFGCTAANPCAAIDVDYFGVMTIPFLALLAFVIIHIFATFGLFSKKIEKAGK